MCKRRQGAVKMSWFVSLEVVCRFGVGLSRTLSSYVKV